MKVHSIITEACIVIAGLCLSAAYFPGRYWLILPILLVVVFFRRIVKKLLPFWISSTLLAAYVLLAAAGVARDLSLPLILLGCVSALAGWESEDFEWGMVGAPRTKAGAQMEKNHLRLLAAISAAGLALVFLSSYLNLSYPFGVTVLLVLLAMGSLAYSVQILMGKKPSG